MLRMVLTGLLVAWMVALVRLLPARPSPAPVVGRTLRRLRPGA